MKVVSSRMFVNIIGVNFVKTYFIVSFAFSVF